MTQWFTLQCCVWEKSGGAVLFIFPLQKTSHWRWGVGLVLLAPLGSSPSQNLCCHSPQEVCWADLHLSSSLLGTSLLGPSRTFKMHLYNGIESIFIHLPGGLSIQTRVSTSKYLFEMVLSSSQSVSGSVHSIQQSHNWGPGHEEILWHGLNVL